MADKKGDSADIQDVRDVLDLNRGRIGVERERINHFQQFDEEFRRRYRLRKETVNFVNDLVREDRIHFTARNKYYSRTTSVNIT